MQKRRIENQKFQCPKLGDIVHLQIVYVDDYSDQLSSPTISKPVQFECREQSQCGIGDQVLSCLAYEKFC